MGIQVEVCVQDCLNGLGEGDDAASEDQADDLELVCPIAPKTWELWFQRWLDVMQPQRSPIGAYEVSVRLTRDREIQTLNAQYRQHDQPTDVLAFAALEADMPIAIGMEISESLYLGDIIISVETAQRQAQAQAHSLEIELAWLASHGLLHLLGWDHPDDEHLLQMLTQQQTLLRTVGLLIGDS